MEWISIYDKLPEKNGRYLVTFTWAGVRFVDIMSFYRQGSEFYWQSDQFKHRNMRTNVVAWAPLEPYMS
jgi:hypothetical protein